MQHADWALCYVLQSFKKSAKWNIFYKQMQQGNGKNIKIQNNRQNVKLKFSDKLLKILLNPDSGRKFFQIDMAFMMM